ncbi:hypothetical protein WJ438_09815 [Streptomyces sp. GD-15H]|uniref:hypothetical protein n=1 Tax=Streptomyces sp. GD-15H TaxID=3129112 RepID=UPI003251BDEC
MAEARRGPGQQTIEEYARTWLPRQRRTTEYSTAKALASHFKVQINPVIGSRKPNAVTPTVVEDFLDHLAGTRIHCASGRAPLACQGLM